jgi:CubicO group peptidase (beta-lactamase class C family)
MPSSVELHEGRNALKINVMRKACVIMVLGLWATAGPGHSLVQTHVPLKTDIEKRDLIADLEKAVPDLMEKAGIPGLSLAVIRDGEIIWSRGFGVKNTRTGEPVRETTIFEAASLTKPFFAYLVMKMVENGDLDLDTPLIQYAPQDYLEKNYVRHPLDLEGFRRDRFNRITARMVLSHSSGLPHGESRKPLPIFFEPGEKYKYSADGYEYLQRIVEYLKGEPLQETMRKMVIEPLKMKDSSMVWQEAYATQSAVGHNTFGDTTGEFRKRTQAHAAASLYTTAADYARFVAAILNDTGLKKETIAEMLTPQIDVSENVFWGLGFGLERTAGGDAFWQWGDYGIFRNYVVAYKKQKTGVVYLTNSQNGLSIGQEILAHSIGGGQDLGLAYLKYDRYDSPSMEFARVIRSKGIKEAVRFFREQGAKSPGAFNEQSINGLGYMLMNSGRTREAIEVLKLNVEAFPGSANVYDSLAEAYMKGGDDALAIEFYKKTIEMASKDQKADKAFLGGLEKGAREKLEKLEKRTKRRMSQEDAGKSYGPFMGVWEFEVQGFGSLAIKVFAEDGLLWGTAEGGVIGERAEFIPVEGKPLEFKVDSSELGQFDWEFLKDDERKITKCRFTIKGMNLEAFGVKR